MNSDDDVRQETGSTYGMTEQTEESGKTASREESAAQEQQEREIRDGFVPVATRTRINQGNVQMQVHQPAGEIQVVELFEGVELYSRVADDARAQTSIKLNEEMAERLRDRLTEVLESD